MYGRLYIHTCYAWPSPWQAYQTSQEVSYLVWWLLRRVYLMGVYCYLKADFQLVTSETSTFAHCTSTVLHDDVQGHWLGPYHRFLLSHDKLWTVNCMACLWWGGVGFANLKFLWCDIYFNFISRCVSSCSGLVVLSGMCATYPHCMEVGCRSCYSGCTVMWCYTQYIHTYVCMYIHMSADDSYVCRQSL